MYREKRDPFSAPNYDVFVPARRQDPLGIIEGSRLDAGNNYIPWIGLTTVRELALKHADKTRLVDRAEYDENRAALMSAEKRIEQLIAERDKAQSKLDRIAGVAADGFKVQRVMGRPKQKATA